jgi:hypothetical protein
VDKDDAGKLSPADQHERRRQVIRACKRGTVKTQIVEKKAVNDCQRHQSGQSTLDDHRWRIQT